MDATEVESCQRGTTVVDTKDAAATIATIVRLVVIGITNLNCSIVTIVEIQTMTFIAQKASDQPTYLSAAIDAAHVGGRILQDWIGRFSVREKSRANLVTEADEASQSAIVQTPEKPLSSTRIPG
jgi:hypothetical protein